MASLTCVGSAKAWGDKAHQIICQIAFDLALPDTQEKIQDLIALDSKFADFAHSCVFPDHPRIRASEHFVNLPRNGKGIVSEDCPLASECVVTAIAKDEKILSSKDEPGMNRLVALKSLGHWVGDIHQPLHVSFLDDRGGNSIKASGGCRNLHAVWDRCLVDAAIGSDVSRGIESLIATITPIMRTEWTAVGPRDWANESFAVTESVATRYCTMHGASCDPSSDIDVSTEYLDTNIPIVKTQLKKAAVRLARILDAALR